MRTRDLAIKLAKMWGIDCDIVETAALLHDISGIIPNSERVIFALDNGIPVLVEEDNFPLIIHQKISKYIAENVFQIDNELILNAIECHTTLKDNPSIIDKIVFIADKLEWDRDQKPVYYDNVYTALTKISLDAGIEAYLNFVYKHRNEYAVIHPWLNDAFDYFNINYEEKDYISYIRSMVGHRNIILTGAIVIIQNSDGQILLQQRNTSAKGKWGLPGGLMEMGESMEENAVREVYEETGLTIDKDSLTFVGINSGKTSHLKLENGDEFYAVAVCYRTDKYRGKLKINDHESMDLQFFCLDNLPDAMVGSHRWFVEKIV